MTPAEKQMSILTLLIFLATAANVWVFYLESEDTGRQTTKLVSKAGEIVDTMNTALSENRGAISRAFDANERHIQAALDANIAASKSLAAQARRSADIAQAQQAPWVGIEQASFISARPRYAWLPAPVPPDIPNPTIYVETGFSVKNYGGAPAFLEDETMNLMPVPEKGVDLPSLRKACMIDAYRTPGQVTLKGDIGEMILPGAIKMSGVSQNMTHDVRTTKALKRVWITICIVYQDRQTKWHYSGYRYITQSGDAAPVMFPDHPGWSYLPFTRAVLIAASAD
jgi:hypothetical protein